jgi:acyl carrier protein
MNDQEIITALAEILEMEAGELSNDTVLDTVDTWDSLATISFIALVDEKTGHVLAGDDLQKATTIGDLVALAKAGTSGEH